MLVPTITGNVSENHFKDTLNLLLLLGNENAKGPLMLYLGLSLIVFVPIFKTVTHLPPYVGMMLVPYLLLLWLLNLITARQFSVTSLGDEN